MRIKHELRKFLWKFGYDIYGFTPTAHPVARKKQMFKSYETHMTVTVTKEDENS